MAISMQIGIGSVERNRRGQDPCPAQVRAMALWPRLDRRSLSRCGCDPSRIANYVSHRTRMPATAIEALISESPNVETSAERHAVEETRRP